MDDFHSVHALAAATRNAIAFYQQTGRWPPGWPRDVRAELVRLLTGIDPTLANTVEDGFHYRLTPSPHDIIWDPFAPARRLDAWAAILPTHKQTAGRSKSPKTKARSWTKAELENAISKEISDHCQAIAAARSGKKGASKAIKELFAETNLPAVST